MEYTNIELEHMAKQFNDHVISSKINKDGIITCVSNALCKVSGYDMSELIGKPYNFLEYDDESFFDFDNIVKKLEENENYKVKLRNRQKNGMEFWTNAVITPYCDKEGNLLGYSSIQEDITAKVKLLEINNDLENIVIEKVNNLVSKDQQLLKHSKLAAMGEMMNAIAHQWKQPIHAISMAVSQIDMCRNLDIEITDEILDKITKQVDKQVDDLTQTIDEFRQFFKPNQYRELVNIKDSIQKTLGFLDDTIRVNNLKIDLNGDATLEYEIIPQEFKHVFINLIANAIDAFVENNIKERNMIIDIKKEDKFISISVEDNAGGIPSHIIDEVFKVDVTSKAEGKGTGIGLYMSTQIIEKLDGSIDVENVGYEKNGINYKGAKFIVKLPV